jgi:beta-galactosidase
MNTPGGGWPGLCFDNPEPREQAESFLAALVGRYADHPALAVWDVWNEPHLEPASYYPGRMYCYCAASVGRFRAWLRERYGDDLDALNRAWARRYSDWDEVSPPRRTETYPDLLEWREFWFANLASWLDWRAGIVRRLDGIHPVMTHVALSGHAGQLATHTLDEFTLSEPVDIFGTSSFPTWLFEGDLARHAFDLETARDAAAGKPYWQAELQGGRARRHGEATTGHPSAAEIRLWMWNALAAGAKGVVFWQWRPELLGPESPGYGLCAPDGTATQRSRAAGAMARLFRDFPALVGARPAQPSVAVVLSRRTALLAFASEDTIALYARAAIGAHRLFFDADVATCFLHEDVLERSGVPTGVRTVYWPLPSVATPQLAARLAAFVRDGGTLIAEAGPGRYDRLGWYSTGLPGSGLDDLFGARVVGSDHSGPASLDTALGPLTGDWQLDSLEPAGGETLGWGPSGAPAVIRHATEAGSATLIGSHPSLAYYADRSAATRSTIVAMTSFATGPLLWDEPEPGRFHRHLRSRDGDSIIAINATERPAAAKVPGDVKLRVTYADDTSGEQRADELLIPARAGVLIDWANSS